MANTARSGTRKLLAIGLDGGDYDFIASRRGTLPNLATLLEAGPVARPNGPFALSGSVWPTFYQGTHPGEHGVYQHLVWDAERMGLKIIAPSWVPYRPFWQTLEEEGHDVVVLDVPYSFPTGLTRGTVITDWGTHGQTHPLAASTAEALRLVQRFGRSPIGRETPIAKSEGQLRALLPPLLESAHRKGLLIERLMDAAPWDLLLAVFGETHRGGHLYFSADDRPDANAAKAAQHTPLLEVYRAVDTAVGRILDKVDEDADVLLFSVHGMTTNWAQEHAAARVIAGVNRLFLEEMTDLPAAAPSRRGGLLGRVRALVPTRLEYAVGVAAPDWFRRWVVEREIVGGLDWSRTPGLLLRGDIRTELRLNLEGREARGMLKPGSVRHERYVELLREAFETLRDADSGQALVANFVDMHATFPGERAEDLPDYVVDWRPAPSARRVSTPLLGEIELVQPGTRGGDHVDVGFAALRLARGTAPVSLPPLDDTWDFAEYIGALVRRTAADEIRESA